MNASYALFLMEELEKEIIKISGLEQLNLKIDVNIYLGQLPETMAKSISKKFEETFKDMTGYSNWINTQATDRTEVIIFMPE